MKQDEKKSGEREGKIKRKKEREKEMFLQLKSIAKCIDQ